MAARFSKTIPFGRVIGGSSNSLQLIDQARRFARVDICTSARNLEAASASDHPSLASVIRNDGGNYAAGIDLEPILGGSDTAFVAGAGKENTKSIAIANHVNWEEVARSITFPPRRLNQTLPAVGKGGNVTLDAVWMRDNCPCEICVSKSSGNKSFSTSEIPHDIEFESVRRTENGLEVRWRNDIPRLAVNGHVSTYAPELLGQLLEPHTEADLRVPRRVTAKLLWDNEILQKRFHRIDYKDWMEGGDAFWRGLLDLEHAGITFLKNVPRSESSVVNIAEKISNIQETFYGRTFDVISKPDAENVAYTSAYLGLHQDLLYLAQTPRIQLLHCLDNSCDGGESIFADADRAAVEMMASQPDLAAWLATYPTTYHYNKNGYLYRQTRTTFNMDNGELANVWWSPPFQAPAAPINSSQARYRYRHMHLAKFYYNKLLNDPANLFQYKMQPGDCVLFDNRRSMHGRLAFNTSSGQRWLRGAYISDEDFTSKIHQAPQAARANYPAATDISAQEEMQSQMEYLLKHRYGGIQPLAVRAPIESRARNSLYSNKPDMWVSEGYRMQGLEDKVTALRDSWPENP
jgi:gamma-butyrobetaine dioxygenase